MSAAIDYCGACHCFNPSDCRLRPTTPDHIAADETARDHDGERDGDLADNGDIDAHTDFTKDTATEGEV